MTQLALPMEFSDDGFVRKFLQYLLLVQAIKRAWDVAYYWLCPNRRRAQRLKSKHKSKGWREHSRGWA